MKYLFLNIDPSITSSIYNIDHNGISIIKSNNLIDFELIHYEVYEIIKNSKFSIIEECIKLCRYIKDLFLKFMEQETFDFVFLIYEEFIVQKMTASWMIGKDSNPMQLLTEYIKNWDLIPNINKQIIRRSQSKTIKDININRYVDTTLIKSYNKRHIFDSLRLFVVFINKLNGYNKTITLPLLNQEGEKFYF